MSIADQIVRYIERNRISTVEVADVLGKAGQITGVHALTPGLHKVGRVACVYAARNTNYDVHRQLAEANLEDRILFVANIDCDRAIFGDLVSKYILLYKRATAIVVPGLLRDAHALLKERYPVWLSGVSPIGCVNTPAADPPSAEEIRCALSAYEGSVMVCDDSGVVMIPHKELTRAFLSKLEAIELQEDIWFYCLDSLKMSTFDIVCRKRYLKGGVIDPSVLDRVAVLSGRGGSGK